MPEYYTKYPTRVLNFGMNQYTYVCVRRTPPISKCLGQLQYSCTECYDNVGEILHDGVRGTLEYLGDHGNVEMNVMVDLPARTGSGSSSSFVVAMTAGMRQLRGESWNYQSICRDAIKIEREVLGEAGGVQDQIAAAYPGFNIINLSDRGIERVAYDDDFLQLIVDRCVLFYLGRERKSFKIAAEYSKAEALENQHRIREIAEDGYEAIMRGDYELLRHAIDESWEQKKRISPLISTPEVDSYVGQIRDLGGATKLMGSGGAGFIMTLLPESADKVEFIQAVKLHAVDVGLDREGVVIL